MALARFDVPGRATIWAVDDAWFNVTGPQNDKYPIAGRLSNWDTITDLGVLEMALKAEFENTGNPNVGYLLALVRVCRKENYALCLASFEDFEHDFSLANKKQTACLVDVKYEQKGEEGNSWGVDLVQRLLKGGRPVCDLFFVTAAKEFVTERIRAHFTDSSWWPLRSIPVVDKPIDIEPHGQNEFERLEAELDAFARYFAMGLGPDNQVRQMVKSLLDARVLPHPSAIGELRTHLPDDFFFVDLFY
jgi:hypothetical protein